MRFRIHRAAAEIGGNCIEVEAQGSSILLDLGFPLSGSPEPATLLPDLPGLKGVPDPHLLGVILSHPHQDHYGLLSHAPKDLPVYLGREAILMLRAAELFTRDKAIPQVLTPYTSGAQFQVGPFRITPYLVDHSAFDAHALLVEADGARLFYSGDFRMHGRKARSIVVETEDDLERRLAKRLDQCKGLVLAYAAGQNIDRLVTFYRAALRSERGLVLDAYAAHVLGAVGRSSLPSADAPRVRVFLPAAQRRRILDGGHANVLDAYRRKRTYAEELRRDGKRWVMLFRDSMRRDIETIAPPHATLIYSLWEGHIAKGRGPSIDCWASQLGIEFEIVHTSGHATPDDLQRLVTAIRPRRLVPMHTVRPEAFRDFHQAVELVGSEWSPV